MPAESTGPAAFVVTRFEAADSPRWDEFVHRASNGTFLHSRRYLGYHRDRFTDESILLHTEHGTIVAVMPAATAPSDGTTVVSHPGLTFGGLVYDDSLRGERLVEALATALAWFADHGYSDLDYRPVPVFARRSFGNEDVYSAARLGARRTSCHLSAVLDVARPRGIDAKKRNMLRKADRAGVVVHEGADRLPAFWDLLVEQLAARFSATPVHTLTEITELVELFPDQIRLRVATVDDTVVAGAVTYQYNDDVIHTQYLASDPNGRRTAALELVCDEIISAAGQRGMRYVSFGPSSNDDGRTLNDQLYRFKHSFGASGVAVESYRVPCRAS